MAKLGRYSADRKKIESLTAAKTVEVADCGTIFTLNLAAGAAVTLPDASSAGKGWWCKFILATKNTGGAWTIDASSGDGNNMYGLVVDSSGGNEDEHGGTVGDQLSFTANTGEIGCQAELVSDGTSWFVIAHSNVTGAITVD